MTQMLKLQVWTFKITVINILKALKEKEDNMQDQIGNFTERQKLQNKSTGNAKNKKLSYRNEECF